MDVITESMHALGGRKGGRERERKGGGAMKAPWPMHSPCPPATTERDKVQLKNYEIMYSKD